MSLLSQCSTEQLQEYVKSSTCYKEVMEKLGYRAYSGSIQQLLRERLRLENISTEHFTAPTGNRIIKRTFENTFCENSTVDQKTLKKKYKEGDYTEYKCSICGQEPFWNGQELILILDHINGINNDDRIDNLRWVCPNCNYQLDTTNGKNIKRLRDLGILGQVKKYYCKDCGKEVSGSTTERCAECAAKARIIPIEELPVTREELKILIRTIPFTAIGKQFNMSDNMVRKWCDKFGLPRRATDIKKYTNEEWELI